MKYKRIFLIILDSLGVGATKDADRYGDGLANSFFNVIKEENIDFPNFRSLGMYNLAEDVEPEEVNGFYTKATPNYKMKCSVISQYELMGSICKMEYKRFNINEIDKEFLSLLETDVDRRIIFVNNDDDKNIINEYGINHMKNGNLIITYDYYNLKIFAHESVIPLKTLVKLSRTIIDDFTDAGYFINKVIAKTFTGKPGEFVINKERGTIPFPDKDETVLSKIKKKGLKVITIGKSAKIFNPNEITNICFTNNDLESAKRLIQSTILNFEGLCVTNLSELNYCGHDRNPHNYLKVLKNFDNLLPLIMKQLTDDDLLIITSDQGNDPTYSGNDHTREKVPVLAFTPRFLKGGELPYLQTLADVGATIADNFDIEMPYGTSFLKNIK